MIRNINSLKGHGMYAMANILMAAAIKKVFPAKRITKENISKGGVWVEMEDQEGEPSYYDLVHFNYEDGGFCVPAPMLKDWILDPVYEWATKAERIQHNREIKSGVPEIDITDYETELMFRQGIEDVMSVFEEPKSILWPGAIQMHRLGWCFVMAEAGERLEIYKIAPDFDRAISVVEELRAWSPETKLFVVNPVWGIFATRNPMGTPFMTCDPYGSRMMFPKSMDENREVIIQCLTELMEGCGLDFRIAQEKGIPKIEINYPWYDGLMFIGEILNAGLPRISERAYSPLLYAVGDMPW